MLLAVSLWLISFTDANRPRPRRTVRAPARALLGARASRARRAALLAARARAGRAQLPRLLLRRAPPALGRRRRADLRRHHRQPLGRPLRVDSARVFTDARYGGALPRRGRGDAPPRLRVSALG